MKSVSPGGFVGHMTPFSGGFKVYYNVRANGRVYTKWFRTRIEANAFLRDEEPPTANDFIQYWMHENEKAVLAHIRKFNKKFQGYRPVGALGSWWGAINRLELKEKIFYRRTRTLSSYGMSGYWIRTSTRSK